MRREQEEVRNHSSCLFLILLFAMYYTVLQNMQRIGGKVDDATSKVLHGMRHAAHAQFLSGSRKESIVKKRKVSEQNKQNDKTYLS